MEISADKQHVTLRIQQTYDAAGLEALIAQLTEARAALEPAVAAFPPSREEGEDAAARRARGDPRVQVAVMRDGNTRFWVRHEGIGWFGFNLPVERANMLASVILDATSHLGPVDDLARLKRRQSDLYH